MRRFNKVNNEMQTIMIKILSNGKYHAQDSVPRRRIELLSKV